MTNRGLLKKPIAIGCLMVLKNLFTTRYAWGIIIFKGNFFERKIFDV
jgi:hypothetical protein